jgi:predicted metal-dependent hydrolase
MITQLQLGDIAVEVVSKDVKNVHLSVYPPTGRVRITAPTRMDLDTIRVFAISKLAWIKSQQKKFDTQAREPLREFIDRESHYLWGTRYLLEIVEKDASPLVDVQHKRIVLQVRPGADAEKRQEVLEDWYRAEVKRAAPAIIAKWAPPMGVTVRRFYVQRMKTKWGSCTRATGTIRLNTDLARKPPECLEYIIVHEMAHMLEPTHGKRFRAQMDAVMPKWKYLRAELNELPVRHEHWEARADGRA